jgi:RNA-directed DNA polymerase
MFRKWLKAGYLEKNVLYPTDSGTPQGGIISPVAANLTLDGLEKLLKSKYPANQGKVNLIRFADDFVITGASRELLEQEIKPLVQGFLAERGLELSPEKTQITRIEDDFDFLGHNVRKYKGKLLIKPAKKLFEK